MKLIESTWPEVGAATDRVAVIPTGSIEQHGKHLPLATDTLLATAVAEALEAALPDQVLLTPSLWLGASEHHMGFAGTLTATIDSYRASLRAVIHSLSHHGFSKFLVVNGHGGNSDLNRLTLREVKLAQAKDHQLVLVQQDYYAGIPAETYAATLEGEYKFIRHACEAETSLMLHLYPHLVKMSLARRDGLRPDPPIAGWLTHFDEVTQEGSLGRADLGTAEKGKVLFEAALATLKKSVEAIHQGLVLVDEQA